MAILLSTSYTGYIFTYISCNKSKHSIKTPKRRKEIAWSIRLYIMVISMNMRPNFERSFHVNVRYTAINYSDLNVNFMEKRWQYVYFLIGTRVVDLSLCY